MNPEIKEMFDKAFEEMYKRINDMYEIAQKDMKDFDSETMIAFYRGEMLGYERVNRQVELMEEHIKKELEEMFIEKIVGVK